MEHRRLGTSEIEVSALSLGSWRTFERLPREAGVAVMVAAREHGIDFLDDARYDDDTGTAPLPTGYSEVVFGELFRASGWKRDDVRVANKLWWEFWPGQTAAQELEASLTRMKLDYLDLVYSERPPEGLSVDELVGALGELIASGRVRAWGILNWPPGLIRDAANGVPQSCAAQLAYSLAYPFVVEDDEMVEALDASGASIVASAVLANGALTGKYDGEETGRLVELREDPRRQEAFRIGERLRLLAERLDTTPARLAIAFALSNPRVATVLFGATRPEQVEDNVGALELLTTMSPSDLAAVHALRVHGEV